MAFISNRQLEGTTIGSKLKLDADVSVLKGLFKAGSIVEVIGNPDERGEFLCKDIKSGEEVYLHPAISKYSKA